MANTKISRTKGVSTDLKKFTLSLWFKRARLGEATASSHCLYMNYLDGNNRSYAELEGGSTGDTIYFFDKYGSSRVDKRTTRYFKDTNGWYHFLIKCDTTQATEAHRWRLYINGIEETSFAGTGTMPAQNASMGWQGNSASNEHNFGMKESSNSPFEGCMSHIHYCDGYAYDPTEFGEFDSVTGIWKIKTAPSVNYGTQGYFVLKDGNSVTDQSGNSNNFSVTGTLTKTEDCPSNVFNTLNVNDRRNTSLEIYNGNTVVSGAGGGDTGLRSTISPSKGKWYWEMKADNTGNSVGIMKQGIQLVDSMLDSTPSSNAWGLQSISSGVKTNVYTNGTFTSYTAGSGNNFPNWGSSDVLCCAMDLDNGKIFFGKNGTFYDNDGNTGDPVNGTNPTFSGLTTGVNYSVYVENRSGSSNASMFNFGNGYFGTTAVSSAGTNASNLGIFEHNVPAGFTAICTKGLNL